jgi:hypothetical protein
MTFSCKVASTEYPLPRIYSCIIQYPTSVIGWSIPSIARWVKRRRQLENLKECIEQVGKLDKNAIAVDAGQNFAKEKKQRIFLLFAVVLMMLRNI